jgi:hypothetical protein
LTFLSDSAPLDAGGALRLVPFASLAEPTMGCCAARSAAARLDRCASREAKSYVAVRADVVAGGRYCEMWSMMICVRAAVDLLTNVWVAESVHTFGHLWGHGGIV